MADFWTWSAATALVAATPVASWGLIGRQDAAGFTRAELDYLVPPLDLAPGLETALGSAALLLAAAAAAVLTWSSWRGRFDQRWWHVVAPLLAAGLVAGAGWRVITAGVIGANIGAGLFIAFGTPLVALLLGYAVISGVRTATGQRSRRRPA
ncbi:MAG TPA: hypothetical protein VFC00_09135 [Micromonosporaceae bacterium]|nr:hypothetical protein [Micromonosporaceae bacterium]